MKKSTLRKLNLIRKSMLVSIITLLIGVLCFVKGFSYYNIPNNAYLLTWCIVGCIFIGRDNNLTNFLRVIGLYNPDYKTYRRR